jgi:hypothetical protein
MTIGTPDPRLPTSAPAGAKALAGGAIATLIGVLLLVFGPSSTPGVPLNPHRMAYAFLAIGIFLLFVGFLARALFK